MGIVYKAHDAELGRRVALKVINPIVAVGAKAEERKERLLREAQALAQLSHPNVVTVYDVGTHGDQVFVAMEYVQGQTLRAWLDAAPRKPREIIEVLSAAGRGLAAAHSRGLIHRDFKPDNVLIGEDQRVRVVDFGLARWSDLDGALPSSDAPASAGPGDRLRADLTHTDVAVGTPRYMAPEQYERGRADAKADQFALCAVLYEALYRQAPFEGDTLTELRSQVRAGALRSPPKGARVDARMQAVLERGLCTDPADRFASMDALLAELAAKPSSGAASAVIAFGVAAVVGIGALAAWSSGLVETSATKAVSDAVPSPPAPTVSAPPPTSTQIVTALSASSSARVPPPRAPPTTTPPTTRPKPRPKTEPRPFNVAQARALLAKNAAFATGCRRGDEPAGTVYVMVQFALSGHISSVALVSKKHGAATGACVASSMTQGKVDAYEGAVQVRRWPINLQ